jgi:hypothetical protein
MPMMGKYFLSGFMSLKAVPEPVSKTPGRQHDRRTKMMAILGEEGSARPEVYSTADDIQSAEFRPIWLAGRGIAKTLAVVAMVCIGFGLPARYPGKRNFGGRESNANHSAQRLSARSRKHGEGAPYLSFPLDTIVTS